MYTLADKTGITGVLLGFIALAIVLFQFFYGPVNQKPAESDFNQAKSAVKSFFSSKSTRTNKEKKQLC